MKVSIPDVPRNSSTSSRVTLLCPPERHWSRMLSPSRTEPSAFAAMSLSASSLTSMPWSLHIAFIPLTSVFSDTLLKSRRIHLESIVAGSFCGSVVASMNTTYSGGSSRVLSSALNASVESICTSSIIYIFFLPIAGGYFTLSRSSLIFSTPLFDAASISMTSINVPSFMERQLAHLPHGLSLSARQFKPLASIRAVVVFPVPRVPQNK